MAKSALDAHADAQEAQETAAPKTLGDLFPGLTKEIDGVNIHSLSLGHLQDLLEDGIASQFAASEKRATYGMKSSDAGYEEAKKSGRADAIKAFEDGLLPTNLPAESDHVQKSAQKYIEAYRDEVFANAKDRDATEAAWYAGKMNAEEKADLAKPRNQARANCVKRLAREWLAKSESEIPESARAKRAEVVNKGKEAYRATLLNAKARVERNAHVLLTPYHPGSEGAEPSAPVDHGADMGF